MCGAGVCNVTDKLQSGRRTRSRPRGVTIIIVKHDSGSRVGRERKDNKKSQFEKTTVMMMMTRTVLERYGGCRQHPAAPP